MEVCQRQAFKIAKFENMSYRGKKMLANKLNYGDTIGVVGVSNSIEFENKKENFYKAEQFLADKGFKVKRGKYVFESQYGSAGTKEQKAEDMMRMFQDKEVKAIVCLRGGQTCNTFIDLLDYDVIKQNPKIIIGYSDITVLLQTIYHKTGLVTFHGPDFLDFAENNAEERYEDFESVLVNQKIGKFHTGEKKVIRSGNAQGELIGTNLGCMMHLIGTEYLPDMQDKILAMESFVTSPNECQRRFAHLKQVGIFDKIKGVIIGYNYDLQKDGNAFPQMEDILLEYTKEYDFPIIKCNDFGHMMVNSVIPIGAKCQINSKNNEVKITDQFLQ